MGYALTLFGAATVLVLVIQSLRIVWRSDFYRVVSLNLTIAFSMLLIPTSISVALVSLNVSDNLIDFLVFISGIGSLCSIYFFAKAILVKSNL